MNRPAAHPAVGCRGRPSMVASSSADVGRFGCARWLGGRANAGFGLAWVALELAGAHLSRSPSALHSLKLECGHAIPLTSPVAVTCPRIETARLPAARVGRPVARGSPVWRAQPVRHHRPRTMPDPGFLPQTRIHSRLLRGTWRAARPQTDPVASRENRSPAGPTARDSGPS